MPARDGYPGAELLSVPHGKRPHKSPSRQSISSRHSSTSLRQPSSLGQEIDGGGNDDELVGGAANGHRFSLAHELAAALMPDPNASSRRLAEEFGIEYDEGAEGIDEDIHFTTDGSIADANTTPSAQSRSVSPAPHNDDLQPAVDEDFTINGASSLARRRNSPDLSLQSPQVDPLVLLSQNLQSTDVFLTQLRRLDTDISSSHILHAEPPLERMASDMIRRINDTAREREGQVRELQLCEREFRKIAGEIGGNDVLGDLEELENVDDLVDSHVVAAEADASAPEWDSESHQLGILDEQEEEEEEEEPVDVYDDPITLSPVKDSFPPPPDPVTGPATPSKALPHLAYMRTLTQSLVGSLTTISEHAQVNGAATADAGRKLRALKNKLGGWRADWESAERSRLRIERWESGLTDNINDGDVEMLPGLSSSSTTSDEDSPAPGTPAFGAIRRIDARQIVQAELDAFAIVLAQAAVRTTAIMTA